MAVEGLLEEGLESVRARHQRAAERCRQRAGGLGVDLYPSAELSSPTVTALHLPNEATTVQQRLRADHDIVMATSLGPLAEDILRVGHMGYNADIEKVDRVMDAIGDVVS